MDGGPRERVHTHTAKAVRTEYAAPTRVSPSQLGPARVSGESDSKEETLPLLTHPQHTPHAAVWDAFARSTVLDCPRCKRLSAAAPSLRCSSSIDCSQTHTSEQFSGWISTFAGIIFCLKCRMLIFQRFTFSVYFFWGTESPTATAAFVKDSVSEHNRVTGSPPPAGFAFFFIPPPGSHNCAKEASKRRLSPSFFGHDSALAVLL